MNTTLSNDSKQFAEAQALANSIIEILENKEERILGIIKKRPSRQTQRGILSASQAYIRKFRQRHGTLKILGMNKSISLDSIYVPTRFLESSKTNKVNKCLSRAGQTRASYAKKERGLNADIETWEITAIELANRVQYLSIIGGPGAGKTTFLRKIGLAALKCKNETKFQSNCMPVWVDLKKFNEEKTDFKAYIAKELEYFDFPHSEQLTTNALKKGCLLILFDGLDEVSYNSRDDILDKIEEFVEHYEKNRYILSCRTAAYCCPSSRFRDIVLADNDRDQVRDFIRNWFSSDEKKGQELAEKCWKSLEKPDNFAVIELARTPLLLTFLCLVYNHSKTFSGNRSILYHEGLRILLQKWSEEKRIMKEGIYKGLHVELEEKLLAEIAYQAFISEKILFTKSDLVERIRSFLRRELNAPGNLNGENVLKAITIQQGILIEQSEEIYSFSHLTFQEFLTAKYIHENYSNQELSEIIRRHASNKDWREVFLLIAGLQQDENNSVNLLLCLNQVAQDHINTQRLTELWHWAEQVTNTSSNHKKPIQRRANALYRAFHYAAILAPNKEIRSEFDNIQTRLQAFTYNLGGSTDLAITTYLINALDDTVAQLNRLGRISDPVARNSIQNALKKAIELSQPLAKKLRQKSGQRSLHYLAHDANSPLDDDLERNEIFTGPDFLSLLENLRNLSGRMPDSNYEEFAHQNFLNDLKRVCLSILKVDEAWLMLSPSEISNCQNCLYITDLMLKCKKEVQQLSLELWESAENQILSLNVGNYRPALAIAKTFLDQIGAVSKQEENKWLLVKNIPEHFRLKSPFLVSVVSERLTEEDIKMLSLKSEEIRETDSDFAGVILYQEPPEIAARELLADLRLHNNFKVIPIAMAEIEKVLPIASKCVGLLAKYIERYIGNINFFDDRNAISDKLLFFGRMGLLEQLETDLKRNQSIGLFGLRKSGKTSILLQLTLSCQEQHPVIHIDLQTYSDTGYGVKLLNEILQTLYTFAKAKNPLSEKPPLLSEDRSQLKESCCRRFEQHFKQLAKNLEEGGYRLPILCFLDEMERIFPRRHKENYLEKVEEFNSIFGSLRALSQTESLISLLITDVRPNCSRLNQWDSDMPSNPLFQFLKEVFLTPFPDNETHSMISDIGGLMKWEYDAKTIQKIHSLSGGHPFLARKLASFLYKKLSIRDDLQIDGKIIFAYSQRYLDKALIDDDELRNYIKDGILGDLRLHNSGMKMYYTLQALNTLSTKSTNSSKNIRGWVNRKDMFFLLRTRLKFSEMQFVDAIDFLEKLGIVRHIERHENDYYRIHIALLKYWFSMLKKA